MSPLFPPTGWTPSLEKKCTRCGKPTGCQLYALCQTCRDTDIILADAAQVVEEREELLWDDNPERYETPMQIRASLGI